MLPLMSLTCIVCNLVLCLVVLLHFIITGSESMESMQFYTLYQITSVISVTAVSYKT